jgi:hypothetical protein
MELFNLKAIELPDQQKRRLIDDRAETVELRAIDSSSGSVSPAKSSRRNQHKRSQLLQKSN